MQGKLGRRIPIVRASRTNVDVHTCGPAVHFDLLVGTEAPLPLTMQMTPKDNGHKQEHNAFYTGLEQSMNCMLPTDVCIFDVHQAPCTVRMASLSSASVVGTSHWDVIMDVRTGKGHCQ